MIDTLSTPELAYCIVVLLFTFALRGSLGFGGGLFLFKSLDAVLLARTLGAFIIVYAIYSLWMTTRPADSTPLVPPALLRPFASFFSGAVGTLFGAMASIFFAMYLDASGANKQTFRATLSAMLLTLSLARTVGYAAVHELTLDSFILCAAAIPAMGIGLLLGDKIHSGLSQAAFQRVVCAALFLCGIPLLMR